MAALYAQKVDIEAIPVFSWVSCILTPLGWSGSSSMTGSWW